jgi:predicted nucleotidyltransferase component of viral defense system
MIPQNYIIEWKNSAPWKDNAQIEQDLILSRAIVAIYSNPILKEGLVFRGGTALHKLYSPIQERYSEDLDFVQKTAEPIGNLLHHLHEVLNPWLGEPKWKQTQGRVTFYYTYESEISPIRKMKIKIEINTREHHVYSKLVHLPFSTKSSWFSGDAEVLSYDLEELMGTKLRALYQRKKGRDLFDLWVMTQHYLSLDRKKVIDCFLFYLEKEGNSISRAEFEKNMDHKLKDNIFLDDIVPLLSPNKAYSHAEAYAVVQESLIAFLPGDPWKKK